MCSPSRAASVIALDAEREETLQPSKFAYSRDREYEWQGGGVDSEESGGEEEQKSSHSSEEGGAGSLTSLPALLLGRGARGARGNRSRRGEERGRRGGGERGRGRRGGGERGRGGGTRRKATKQPEFLDFSDSSSEGSDEELDKVQRVNRAL